MRSISRTSAQREKTMGKISFKYNGKCYEVDMKAYDRNRCIVLSDGTVLKANDWIESKTMPPKHQGFKVVNRISSQDTPERVAELMNGIVATPVGETPVLDLTHVSAADIEAALFKAYPDEATRQFYAKV